MFARANIWGENGFALVHNLKRSIIRFTNYY
jgi:hypothetical protein